MLCHAVQAQTLLFCHADVSSSPLSHLVEVGTPVIGNDELEKNLVQVEKVALNRGLSPEALSVMLEFAMSLRMGKPVTLPLLKAFCCNSSAQREAVVRAVVWLSVGKIPISTQVLFIKWVLTVFDMIDAKDRLRAIYGFIFSFVTDENLVYDLLLQKLNHLELPAMSAVTNKEPQMEQTSRRKLVPLVQIQSFSQLLENMHRIEMGSLLGSSLALQYLDCVQDESALLRLNFWLGYALHEEFLFCSDGGANQNAGEALQFLNRLLCAQHFLQVCDTFLKFGLPLMVMPPPGVFYTAFFATDPVSVDRLAYIMHRYKVNLTSAKSQEKVTKQAFHINRQTFRDFNHYLVFMVNTLWNSNMCYTETNLQLSEELLEKSGVPQYSTRFDLIHHPAFMSYAVDFHQKQSKPWSWYLEYLFTQGFDGLKDFIHNNIGRWA
ncbi:hypothetical protein GOODEAATRI_012826 [Goodea atripinnis]|uniref:Centromere protein I n=1 Tax=Goodea atripinnis TaxID=208336 RepID=A0ABV0PXI9_9TELE